MDSELKKTISEKFIEFQAQFRKEESVDSQQGNFDSIDLISSNGEVKETNGEVVRLCNGDNSNEGGEYSDNKLPRWPTGYRTQASALCKRAFIQSRKEMLDKLGFIQIFCIAFISGLLWFNTPYDEDSLHDRKGVIFFILVYLSMNPMFQAVLTFPTERNAIAKERAAGMYRLSAYYTAKSLSELPVLMIQPLLVYTISYWMTGLNRSHWFIVGVFVIATIAILSQSIGLVLGGAIKHFKQSLTCAIVVALTTMVLGGFYTRRIPSWLYWTRFLSFVSYGYNILIRIEFEHAVETFSCAAVSAYEVCKNNGTFITGADILPNVTTIDLGIAESLTMLWLFIILFRIIFYLVLKYLNKPT